MHAMIMASKLHGVRRDDYLIQTNARLYLHTKKDTQLAYRKGSKGIQVKSKCHLARVVRTLFDSKEIGCIWRKTSLYFEEV